MAQYQHQLQPFEENQSPSPVHEINDPFAALSQSRSRTSQHSKEASSPNNTLHRQLSGDPDAPPPAWKRRASFTQNPKSQSPPPKPSAELSPTRSTLPAPLSRRHPQLQMTTTASRPPIPAPMFDSPHGSSTSLHDPALAPPQPAFLRKNNGTRSNRSSIHSVDTSGMTSEDLWNLDAEPIADMSNPQRNAMERPLDTVRRMSQRSEKRPGSISRYTAMPADFMWPTAPPEEEMQLPMRRKSKSTTNVPSLALTSRLGRKKTTRQISADPAMIAKVMHNPSSPDSQTTPRANSIFISSAHSSSTDLSKGLPQNKSQSSLGTRPPSTFYSRDFLNQIGPREGGYAIAAMLSAPPTPGQSPVMSAAEEKRKSVNLGNRPPPTSRSAGMGRWSLDGGEHYNNRPYPSTSSANTTSSNLSAPPITSPSSSPPADAHGDLATSPEGILASRTENPMEANSISLASTPLYPSPLSRAVSDEPTTPRPEEAAPLPEPAIIPIPPIPASSSAALPVLSTKQSKKQLAKEAKATEKADTAKLMEQRAARAREDAAKKQAEKDKAKEMKESAKRREKEEKEKKKVENRKTWTMPLMGDKAKNASQVKITPAGGGIPFPAQTRPQEPPISRVTTVPAKAAPPPAAVDGTRRNVSMPMGSGSTSKAGKEEGTKKKSGFFDSLRKRFSTAPAADTKGRSAPAPPRAPVRLDTPPVPVVANNPGPSHTMSTFVAPSSSNSEPAIPPHPQPAKEEQEVIVIDSVTQAEDLPPRTTSIHQSSPKPNGSHSRNPSETAAPAAFEEYNQPQHTSPQPRRNSVLGPRPMPRSSSVTSRNGRQHGAAVDGASMAELSQTQSHLTSSSRTDDSGSSSQTRSSQTPMTSDDGKMDYQGKAVPDVIPEREGSGDTVTNRVGVPAG